MSTKTYQVPVEFEKAITVILEKSIKCRIRSFQFRNKQMEAFKNSNDLSIASLQARLKGDIDTSDKLWQQAIELKNAAKKLSEDCERLQNKSGELERVFYMLLEEFKL